MARERKVSTESKIISAAWNLFYKYGYDKTTVDEIIEMSGIAKSTFYHYFKNKDELLSTLSTLFDDKYCSLADELDESMNSFDKLLYLNKEVFNMIDESVNRELMASLYSSQLVTKGQRHLLDQNRIYYKLLMKIISEGQSKGEIINDFSSQELVNIYAMCERAFIYEWCINKERTSIKEYSTRILPLFLYKFRTEAIESL